MRIKQNMRIQGKEVKRVENSIAMKKKTDKDHLNLPIISAGEYAEELSVYTDKDGNKAVVPPGWTVSEKKEENIIWGKNLGLVIYNIPKEKICDINWTDPDEVDRLERTYDQLVWIPVSLLEANGTLDGEHFSEKLGRRNYMEDEFADDKYHEELNDELLAQLESVKKYGGFYISRYNISMNLAGKPQSVKGVRPLLSDFDDAKKFVSTIEYNEKVKSHLTFGAEYDTVLEWFIKTEVRSFDEIAEDSTLWGNYALDSYFCTISRNVVVTGCAEDCCTNNIYDLAGNVQEWTQEQHGSFGRVMRGGNYEVSGYYMPVAYRYHVPTCPAFTFGFRATLYIK